jgi:hypothetical protein
MIDLKQEFFETSLITRPQYAELVNTKKRHKAQGSRRAEKLHALRLKP